MKKAEKYLKKRKQNSGITLVALVITIIIIIILATVTINMAFGDNGLIKQAQLARDLSANSTVAEGEGMNSLLDEFGNIIGEDGSDTGGDGEEGDTGDDSTIEDLENTIKDLNNTIDDLNQQLDAEKDKVANLEEEKADLEQQIEEGQTTIEEQQGEIDNLNGQISDKNETISNLESTISSLQSQVSSLETQVANLQKMQATGTATAGQVLTGYTFSNSSSVGLSGSMPNRGALNWSGSNTTYTIPAGYYSGGTIDSRPSYTNGYNAGYSAGNTAGRTIKSITVTCSYTQDDFSVNSSTVDSFSASYSISGTIVMIDCYRADGNYRNVWSSYSNLIYAMKHTKYTTYSSSVATVTNTYFKMPANDGSGSQATGTAVIYYI